MINRTRLKHVLKYAVVALIVAIPIYIIVSYEPQSNVETDEVVIDSAELTEAEQAVDQTFDKVEPVINEWLDTIPATASIVLADTETGASITVDEGLQMSSASLYKLFVAYAVYNRLDQGALVKHQFVGNTGRTIETCLWDMITWSDNDCGEGLGELIGWSEIQDYVEELGFANTNIDNSVGSGSEGQRLTTTAEDVSGLLWDLIAGDVLSNDSALELMDLLGNQSINDRVPVELEDSGIMFFHKTANIDAAFHDVGFIATADNKIFLYVIMTNGWTQQELETAGASFQELLQGIALAI